MEHFEEVWLLLLEFQGNSVEVKLMSEEPKKKIHNPHKIYFYGIFCFYD